MEQINYFGKAALTREDIQRADSYLSLLNKAALARQMAPSCVEKVSIAVPVNGEGGGLIPVPEIYQESLMHRSLCSMFVLTYFYLKMPDVTQQYDPNGEAKLAANDYDRYGNVLVQLERLKSDREVRDKVFELLADYKDFERRLGAEIHSLLNIRNDVCTRITSMLMMQTDPASIQKALEQADELARQVKEQAAGVKADALNLGARAARKKAVEQRMNETAKSFGGAGS